MPTVSTPVLTTSNLDSTTVRLSVAYTVTFSPGEQLAGQVFEESISIYASPDEWAIYANVMNLFWGGDPGRIDFWSTTLADAFAAGGSSLARTRSVDVARETLDVAMPGGEMLSALVRVAPYAPPTPQVASSNRVSGDWGS